MGGAELRRGPQMGPGGPEITLETTEAGGMRPRGQAPRRGDLVGRNVWTLPFHPEGVEAARTTKGRVSRRVRMDSSRGRPSGSTWVAPPTEWLVLYRDATSSLGTCQVLLTTPRPRGRGKRRIDQGGVLVFRLTGRVGGIKVQVRQYSGTTGQGWSASRLTQDTPAPSPTTEH